MFKLFGFVIQSEAERKKEWDVFDSVHEENEQLERMVDNCLNVIENQNKEINDLETIIQRYKEKLRGENEQTKS